MGGTLKIFLGVLLHSRKTVKIYRYRAAARILSAQPPPNKFEGATHYCISLLEWAPARGIPVILQREDINSLMGGTLKIFLGVLLRSRKTVKIYRYRAAACALPIPDTGIVPLLSRRGQFSPNWIVMNITYRIYDCLRRCDISVISTTSLPKMIRPMFLSGSK